MKQFLLTMAGVVAGLVLFFVGAPLLIAAWFISASQPAPLAGKNVLVLDLRGGLTDQEARDPFALLQGKSLSVLGVEQKLRRASRDGAVAGLFVRLPEGSMAPAAADELREAFLAFRAARKPILAYSQGLYASGSAVATYELGAASGDLWMQPGSELQVTGYSRDEMFFKRAFDRYGVAADYQQREQYKTAVNPYLYSDYTAAQRESDLSWMEAVYASAVTSAATDRGRDPAAVRAALEAGPEGADQALGHGLIDHVGDLRQASRFMLQRVGQGARFVRFGEYDGGSEDGDGPTIAVIQAEGEISTGTGPGGPSLFGGGSTIRSDDVAKAFHAAEDDNAVKAIVFRLSSPGGSDTASEQILAAVRDARAAGKPVVVSMGAYGASGGYWVSSQASEIVAQPTTLTGSIGVFGGKFVIGPALARFGVDLRHLKVGGDFADALGQDAPMTASQRAAFSGWIDRIYAGFIGRVADGRHLPVDRVRQIAGGRVWTGAQAKSLGLVDRVGGFYDAVAEAKSLAHIQGQARLVTFGGATTPWEALRKVVGSGADGVQALASLGEILRDPATRAVLAKAQDASLRARRRGRARRSALTLSVPGCRPAAGRGSTGRARISLRAGSADPRGGSEAPVSRSHRCGRSRRRRPGCL